MKITSSAFEADDLIPKKYTCQGEDICPPLEIANPPPNTVSFAMIMYDRDAPTGDFVHWIIWNIDPAVRKIEEETTPIGAVEGMNDFGRIGWGGPCPPSGMHRYEFNLYALDSVIDLSPTSDKTDFRTEINGRILEEASLVGLYKQF